MITTPQEYYEKLAQIDELSKAQIALLMPKDEQIYNIDLNARTIDAPEFLSVEADHRAETIYFLVDRFYDNVDLSTTNCVIHYINADGEARVYPVPYFDIETYGTENKMIIPWLIEGAATKSKGKIYYAVKFFLFDHEANKVTYELNTLIASSNILHGMDIGDALHEFNIEEVYETIYQTDDDGNIVLDENGEPIVIERIPVKTMVHTVEDFKKLKFDDTTEIVLTADLLFEVLASVQEIMKTNELTVHWTVLK